MPPKVHQHILKCHPPVRVLNRSGLLRWWSVSTSPNLQARGRPLPEVRYCFFNISPATVLIWTPSPPSQPEDASHRVDRDALSTVDDTLPLLLSSLSSLSSSIFSSSNRITEDVHSLTRWINLLFALYWHSFNYWLRSDIDAWQNKIHNAKNWQERYTKPHESTQQPFISKLLTLSTSDFLKKMAQFVYRMECALDGPKDRIAVRASVFCLLQNFHTGSGAHTATCLICTRRPVREPNKSPPSSAEAMMLSTTVPLVLRFELNERQKVRAVCVCVWNWHVR